MIAKSFDSSFLEKYLFWYSDGFSLKCMIRVAKATDAFAILKIYRPLVKATAISFEFEVPTLIEIEDRIRRTLKKYPWIVFEMSDKVVGYAYANSSTNFSK